MKKPDLFDVLTIVALGVLTVAVAVIMGLLWSSVV